MRISKIGLLIVTLSLIGVGCLGGSKSTGNDGGVFKTSDAGATWTQQTAIVSPKGLGSIATANILSLRIDPEDSRVVYAGTRGTGLLYSLDGASTWQQPRDAALKTGTVTSVDVSPKNVCTLYVALGQYLYKSTDCARSFAPAYSETRAKVTVAQVAVDWYNPDVIWLGLSNGDMLKSEDAGAQWQTSQTAKEAITSILVDNADSRVVLVGTASAGFFKTIDGGASWTQIKDQLKDLRSATKVAWLVQDKTGGTVIAATAYGLIRSTDFGGTWQALQLLTSPGQVTISSVALNPSDANTIAYAAGSTFYRSTDGGSKWTTTTLSTARLPMALVADPSDASVMYLGVAQAEK